MSLFESWDILIVVHSTIWREVGEYEEIIRRDTSIEWCYNCGETKLQGHSCLTHFRALCMGDLLEHQRS